MTTNRLLSVLTDIRDQQKRQIENFEKAIAAQNEHQLIQNKTRGMLKFLIFAPWVALTAFIAWEIARPFLQLA